MLCHRICLFVRNHLQEETKPLAFKRTLQPQGFHQGSNHSDQQRLRRLLTAVHQRITPQQRRPIYQKRLDGAQKRSPQKPSGEPGVRAEEGAATAAAETFLELLQLDLQLVFGEEDKAHESADGRQVESSPL